MLYAADWYQNMILILYVEQGEEMLHTKQINIADLYPRVTIWAQVIKLANPE